MCLHGSGAGARLRHARARHGAAAERRDRGGVAPPPREWAAAGVDSVRIVGDAYAPGTIASAVWDGHRFAEELDGPEPGDAVPFRREVTELLPVVQ